MTSALLIQPVPTGDAVARYERLSHGGTTGYDRMPTPANGTDGTIGAAFTWPNFNGESFVTIGKPAKLDFADAFTIATWSNQSTVPPRQGNERIVSRDDSNAGHRNFLVSQADDSGVIMFIAWTPPPPAAPTAQTAGVYNTDTYHFIAAVNEGAGGDLKVYVDGVLAGTGVGFGGPVVWGAADCEFGRWQKVADFTDYFTGAIDTGRFYGRALSPNEILRDYYAGKPAHP